MADNKDVILIFHFFWNGEDREKQFAIEASGNMTYKQLLEQLEELGTLSLSRTITYSYGEEAKDVIINNDQSLSLAFKIFSEIMNKKVAHLRVYDSM